MPTVREWERKAWCGRGEQNNERLQGKVRGARGDDMRTDEWRVYVRYEMYIIP